MGSLTRYEGYLLLDHTASPGMPAPVAERLGLRAEHVAEGERFETATLTCAHCATAYIKNPLRTRAREFCGKCNRYICDGCAAEAKKSDYVHRSFKELADLVMSGRFTIVGGTASAPLIIPTKNRG